VRRESEVETRGYKIRERDKSTNLIRKLKKTSYATFKPTNHSHIYSHKKQQNSISKKIKHPLDELILVNSMMKA